MAIAGSQSNHKVPEQEQQRIAKLLCGRYSGFGPTFAAEKLAENHKIRRDPKTIRAIMIQVELWRPKPCRTITHHSWRPRRDCYGELQQFDGSYEHWFAVLVRPKDRLTVELRLDSSIHLRLRGKYLSYQVLPARPKKTTPTSWALSNLLPRRIYRPAFDHPRRKFDYAKRTLENS